jgi:phospholipid-binding lipoprotein MlaA
VLPILGPSSVRDSFGLAGDIALDPFFSINKNEVYWGFVTLRVVDRRADLLVAGELMDEAAIDPYAFVRDAYLQRRRALVYDGDPPMSADDDVMWEETEEADLNRNE